MQSQLLPHRRRSASGRSSEKKVSRQAAALRAKDRVTKAHVILIEAAGERRVMRATMPPLPEGGTAQRSATPATPGRPARPSSLHIFSTSRPPNECPTTTGGRSKDATTDARSSAWLCSVPDTFKAPRSLPPCARRLTAEAS
jgi:hypothetical protein